MPWSKVSKISQNHYYRPTFDSNSVYKSHYTRMHSPGKHFPKFSKHPPGDQSGHVLVMGCSIHLVWDFGVVPDSKTMEVFSNFSFERILNRKNGLGVEKFTLFAKWSCNLKAGRTLETEHSAGDRNYIAHHKPTMIGGGFLCRFHRAAKHGIHKVLILVRKI